MDGDGVDGDGVNEDGVHDGGASDAGGDDDVGGGRVIPNSTWIVDYAGDGQYCVRRVAQDGSFDEMVDAKLCASISHMFPEFGAAAHAQVCALHGDTVVFTPLFALIHSLRMKGAVESLVSHQSQRMPRRKHFPTPMWYTVDGVGIIKGSMHSDQFSAFSSALAVNGFNLGLKGCNCAGTKRRWEWVAPAEREDRDDGSGAAGEN